jgi:tetratricopeptide (TPR) repeat protein
MRCGNLEQALKIFSSILSSDLQDPIRHLDHSRGLLELRQYEEAMNGFKKVVTLVRRRKRFPKSQQSSSGEEMSRNSIWERDVLYAAYTGLGKSCEAIGKGDRAIASYTLALKSYRPPTDPSDENWDYFTVGNCEKSLSQLLSASSVGSASHRPSPVVDIEDYLQDYSLLPNESPFRFSCTSCGECCRTSDRILLSPEDIFRLTR